MCGLRILLNHLTLLCKLGVKWKAWSKINNCRMTPYYLINNPFGCSTNRVGAPESSPPSTLTSQRTSLPNTQEPDIPVHTHAAGQNPLRLLANPSKERGGEISRYNTNTRPEDSDDENDSSCTVFDAFYDCVGSASIQQMTNFDAAEFHTVWGMHFEALNWFYKYGPSRKYLHERKDVLSRSLLVLKHVGDWYFLARFFGVKTLNFEMLITKFMDA